MRVVLLYAVPLTLVVTLVAPSPAAQTREPAFAVASIRLNTSGPVFTAATVPRVALQPGGRLTVRNNTLHELLAVAHGVLEHQVAGGPDWVRSDRYDIDARADAELTQDEARSMLRALLVDRFALATHIEVRSLPIYALGLARPDRKTGAQFRPSGATCAPPKSPVGLPPIPPPPPPPAGQQMTLLNNRWPRPCPMIYAPGFISARAMAMDEFAGRLIQLVDRPVLDRTGLKGNFDFELQFTPEFGPAAAAFPAAPPPGSNQPPAPAAPSIFTAVQEQLGLKLESQRGPVDVVVIDRGERPTEN